MLKYSGRQWLSPSGGALARATGVVRSHHLRNATEQHDGTPSGSTSSPPGHLRAFAHGTTAGVASHPAIVKRINVTCEVEKWEYRIANGRETAAAVIRNVLMLMSEALLL